MRRSPLLAVFLLAVVPSCKSSSTEKAPAESASAATAPPPSASASAAAEDPTVAAKALLEAWTQAQTSGDLERYLALYDEVHFRGIKRLAKGGETTYTFATWKKDRERMVKSKPTVVADKPTFTVKGGDVVVDFVQRFRQGGYADHGKKQLVLTTLPSGWKISREEMRTSADGFDDPKHKVNEVDFSKRPGPLSVSLKWRVAPAAQGAPEDFKLHTLVLLVADASKKTTEHKLLEETSDRPVDAAAVAPSKEKGVLFAESFWWAGGGDKFRIVVDAEHLVVKHQVEDEGGSDTEGYVGPFEDEWRFTLPSGGARAVGGP